MLYKDLGISLLWTDAYFFYPKILTNMLVVRISSQRTHAAFSLKTITHIALMSFLKKMMSSVGIGNLTIDTQLQEAEVIAGHTLHGEVLIKGGKAAQQINSVGIELIAELYTEEGTHTYLTLSSCSVLGAIEVAPESTARYPFSLQVPNDAPVSFGNSRVFAKTQADISFALDPKDHDEVVIAPHPLQACAMAALEQLGFRFNEVIFEPAPYQMAARLPVLQVMEYKAMDGEFAGRVDEIDVCCVFHEQTMDVLLEIDRRAGWVAEAFEHDESMVRLTVDLHDTPNVDNFREYLRDLIRRFSA